MHPLRVVTIYKPVKMRQKTATDLLLYRQSSPHCQYLVSSSHSKG